jgi:hypothetical protein
MPGGSCADEIVMRTSDNFGFAVANNQVCEGRWRISQRDPVDMIDSLGICGLNPIGC